MGAGTVHARSRQIVYDTHASRDEVRTACGCWHPLPLPPQFLRFLESAGLRLTVPQLHTLAGDVPPDSGSRWSYEQFNMLLDRVDPPSSAAAATPQADVRRVQAAERRANRMHARQAVLLQRRAAASAVLEVIRGEEGGGVAGAFRQRFP